MDVPVSLGFDTFAFPGQEIMTRWRQGDGTHRYPSGLAGLFRFCGYYLKSPCHREGDWLGHWRILVEQGWGLAVVYVGQQAPEARCCDCNELSDAQGTADSFDAVEVALKDKLPEGTTIFLDVERVDAVSPELRDYVSAWARGMMASRRYHAGLYCHAHNAHDLWGAMLVEGLRVSPVSKPALWVSGGKIRYPFKSKPSFIAPPLPIALAGVEYACPQPADSGIQSALIWQCWLNTKQTFGGHMLHVDINVSISPDPSGVRKAAGVSTSHIVPVDFRPLLERMDVDRA